MFNYVELGINANAYIRLRLSTQGPLWRRLCDLDLEAGHIVAFVPPNAASRDLLHFAWHLNHRADLERGTVDWEFREREKQFIAAYFAGPSSRLGLFRGEPIISQGEDRPRSPRRMPIPLEVCTLTREYPNSSTVKDVIYALRAPATEEQVFEAYEAIEHMPFMALFTSMPVDTRVASVDGEIDEAILPLLIDHTEHILLSAYGDDATLIWSRATAA